jgi:hypothetical protein
MSSRQKLSASAGPDLFEWFEKHEKEERQRVEDVNRKRRVARGFVVIVTDPEAEPTSELYREVYATEARTPAQAVAKVRVQVQGRKRLRAFLATGTYRSELPNATWVH